MKRIAKFIAESGLCSRRQAERLIEQGKVNVDGEIISSPALNVSDKNKILVDGKPLQSKPETRLWLYHKDKNVITTHNDPEGRTTVFDTLPKDMPRVISIGRLDINSEGLLLLTNNGELSRQLELPASGWIRQYRVRVYGETNEKKLESLARGIRLRDQKTGEMVQYGSVIAKQESKKSGKNQWLHFSLKEGKNREIRKICEYLGLEVSRLIRISYGNFKLGSLAPGEIQEVKNFERYLKDIPSESHSRKTPGKKNNKQTE